MVIYAALLVIGVAAVALRGGLFDAQAWTAGKIYSIVVGAFVGLVTVLYWKWRTHRGRGPGTGPGQVAGPWLAVVTFIVYGIANWLLHYLVDDAGRHAFYVGVLLAWFAFVPDIPRLSTATVEDPN